MPRRLLLLGEGERDIGRIGDSQRRVPCSFEGDLPRLVRRLAETLLLETRFGYDANTFRGVVAQIPRRDGRPMRVGGKAKDLRDALVYSLERADPSAIVAVIDAREEEFPGLQVDAADVVAQCSERRTEVPVVIGLALHEIEIWLLADSHARSAAFGEKAGGRALPEGRLEAIRDPKSLWASLAGQLAPPPGVLARDHHDAQRAAAWASLRPDIVAISLPARLRAVRPSEPSSIARCIRQAVAPLTPMSSCSCCVFVSGARALGSLAHLAQRRSVIRFCECVPSQPARADCSSIRPKRERARGGRFGAVRSCR